MRGFLSWYLNRSWVGINPSVSHQDLFEEQDQFETFQEGKMSPDKGKRKLQQDGNLEHQNDNDNDSVSEDGSL